MKMLRCWLGFLGTCIVLELRNRNRSHKLLVILTISLNLEPKPFAIDMFLDNQTLNLTIGDEKGCAWSATIFCILPAL